VRRETISAYLKGAGVEIWPPGRWRRESKAKAAIEVITGSDAVKPAIPGSVSPQPQPRKPFSKGKSKSNFKTGHSGGNLLAESQQDLCRITRSISKRSPVAVAAGDQS
jgi:hypothetical protein